MDRMDSLSWPRGKSSPSFNRQRADVLGIGIGTSVADNAVRALLKEKGFGDSDITAIIRAKNVKSLRAALEMIVRRNVVSSDELLFAALVPSIRRGFVGGNLGRTMSHTAATIETIRWCARREMLQQALALFKERAPSCMAELGYISWVREPRAAADKVNRARVDTLVWLCNRGFPLPANNEIPAERHLAITDKGRSVMPSICYFYGVLNVIRNDVMHLREGNSATYRERFASSLRESYRGPESAMSRIGCAYDRSGTLDALSIDIENALLALEGKICLEPRISPRSS